VQVQRAPPTPAQFQEPAAGQQLRPFVQVIQQEPVIKKLLCATVFIAGAAGAFASKYGCTVLLCLANPASNGGPRAYAACQPSIDRLFRNLRRGRPFPRCEEAEENGTYAVLGSDPYDLCPAPLDLGYAPGQRACIGAVLGSYTIDSPDAGMYAVSVVDAVAWLSPQGARSIDIYIDRAPYSRFHWWVESVLNVL
jgi:hypothetical protein